YYQQALDLYIEFGDRYEQASTLSQIGLLAEDLENLAEAGNYHLQDLQICVEFNDQNRAAFTLKNLQRVYQATQNEALLTEAAQILNTTPDELRQIFESSNESDE
ncbi:MAG: hypothetical protein WA939_15475, partial [Nodosilinea sp.]